MADDWVIQGSRPPSVADNRPHSATGKHHGYHVINRNSTVDESLFKSFHKNPLQSQKNFEAPWNNTIKKGKDKVIIVKNKKTKPLFWSPTPNTSCSDFQILKRGMGVHSEKFKPLKSKASFCDETLFGKSKLSQPSFEAPWECPMRKNIIYKDMNGNTVNINNSNSNWKKLKLRTRPTTAPTSRPLWRP